MICPYAHHEKQKDSVKKCENRKNYILPGVSYFDLCFLLSEFEAKQSLPGQLVLINTPKLFFEKTKKSYSCFKRKKILGASPWQLRMHFLLFSNSTAVTFKISMKRVLKYVFYGIRPPYSRIKTTKAANFLGLETS